MIGHWCHLGGMISGMLIAGYLKLGEDAVEERHLEIGIKASEAAYGYEVGSGQCRSPWSGARTTLMRCWGWRD